MILGVSYYTEKMSLDSQSAVQESTEEADEKR